MRGKHWVVMGADEGIGRLTALRLAEKGGRLVLIGSAKEALMPAVTDIKRRSGNAEVRGLVADRASLADMRRVAEDVRELCPVVDALILNAGAYFPDRKDSRDGLEMHFAVNHLAGFLLTKALKDRLEASEAARVVTVSSSAHQGVSLDFDDLQMTDAYDGWLAFRRSKLCNLYFTFALARTFIGTRMTANAIHPGYVATRSGLDSSATLAPLIGLAERIGLAKPISGARTCVYVATSPDLYGESGEYFTHGGRLARPSKTARMADAARRLWAVSESLTR